MRSGKLGVRLLLLVEKETLPRVNTIAVNGRVLFFSCSLAVLIAFALGLLPALRRGNQDLQSGLKESGRGQSTDLAKKRLRRALVSAQVGLTLVLLAGAGLLGRSFLKLSQIDPGFRTESAIAMTLSLPTTITPQEDERLRQFYGQLLERVRNLPGVTAVGGINVLPPRLGSERHVSNQRRSSPARLCGIPCRQRRLLRSNEIPLLRGRKFGNADTVNSPHVAVISQSLAHKYWPNEDPVGKRIQFGNMDTDKHLLNVIGVVGDVRDALDREAQPTVYAFSLQRPQWWQVSRLAIVVSTQTNPQALIPALRPQCRV